MNPAVVELALAWEAQAAPRGLPWASLPEGVMGSQYLDVMIQEMSAFFDVIGRIDVEARYRTVRAQEGRTSLADLSSALQGVAGDALNAMSDNIWELSPNEALQISREAMKDALATVAGYAVNGAYLHLDGVMYQGLTEGRFTTTEVQAHADDVTKVMQTFVRLDGDGAFDEIRRQEPTAGLGVAPLAIPVWMLVVAGVVLILGVAYLIWSTTRAAKLQDKVVAWCDQLIAADPANAGACIESLQEMQNDSLSQLFKPAQDVVKWLGIGLLAYVALLAAPSVIKGAVGLVRSRKEAA